MELRHTSENGITAMSAVSIRWSGAALTLGALLMGTGIAITTTNVEQMTTAWVAAAFFLGSILTMLALPGIYARQANAAGWLGLAGHVLLATGFVLLLFYAALALLEPDVRGIPDSVTASLLFLALFAGLVMTSIATLRAGVYPRWVGFLLVAACVVLPLATFSDMLPDVSFVPLGALLGAVLGMFFAAGFASLGISAWATSSSTRLPS